MTLEESAAVRLAKLAEIEYYESLADKGEWTKRQNTREVLLQDQVLRAELRATLDEYAKLEDESVGAGGASRRGGPS